MSLVTFSFGRGLRGFRGKDKEIRIIREIRA